jgi:hypothetical protein
MDPIIQGQAGAPPSVGPQLALDTGRSTGTETLEELRVHEASEKRVLYAHDKETGEKEMEDNIQYVSNDEELLHVGKDMTAAEKVDNMEEIALYALHVEDDPSLNPWTFRMWFLGEPPLMSFVGTSNHFQALDCHVFHPC